MPRVKGTPKSGGRKSGTPNKLTADIKAMILGALSAKGGQKYLERQADENPTAFLTLLGKVLPLQMTGREDGPIQVTLVKYAVDTGVPREDASQSLTQKPTSPNHRLPLTAFETHNGRSTFAAGTAPHAPEPPFTIRLRMRWKVPGMEYSGLASLLAARARLFCLGWAIPLS